MPVSPRRPARRIHHPYTGRVDCQRRRQLKEVAAELPRGPGIYFFFGYKDRLLYIGKAKCLRERVRSYFAETSLRRSEKLRRLLMEVKRLEYIECGSDLEALLLERRTIATRRPLLNCEHKRYEIYPYLLLTDEPFPRLTLTRAEPHRDSEDGRSAGVSGLEGFASPMGQNLPLETPPRAGKLPGLHIGPFTTPRVAVLALEAARSMFPLRTCEGAIHPDPAGRACFYFDIGHCGGPCIGTISQPDYAALCADLKSLLETGAAPQLEILKARMGELASAWQFEEAAVIREQLAALAIVTSRLQRLRRMRSRNNAVTVQPSSRGAATFCAFLIHGGLVRRHLTTGSWAELERVIIEEFTAPSPADEFVARTELDEMMVLDRWLRSHGDETACVFIEGIVTSRRAREIVRRLRAT